MSPGTVTLVPGGSGYGLLEYREVITGDCPSASKRTTYELRVYPPGQTQADHAFWDLPACAAASSSVFMSVRVIAPGLGVAGDEG